MQASDEKYRCTNGNTRHGLECSWVVDSIVGLLFPCRYNQLDADHHIALCLERDLLLEDVAMLD